jgi:maltose-binding protein MalE
LVSLCQILQSPLAQRTTLTVDGKTYGLPILFSSPALFWNKAYFREAGLPEEGMLQVARTIGMGTARIAEGMTSFNPDQTWKAVENIEVPK